MVQVLGGRYQLGRVLGSGGMGEVREAIDTQLGRRVAVKLLAGDRVAKAVRARFIREATLAGQFNHPNAVLVYDSGQDGEILYLAMELVTGPSLLQVMTETGPLDPGDAVTIADQILAALGAAHSRGLVHRDVKPSNILFTEDGVAKLADFGIAKGLGELATSLTETGRVMGTPRYLSPEQASGRTATPSSDLYALGVVLYEMLAGRPPFGGDTPYAAAIAHQRQPVPPLVKLRPGLDPDLAAIVERALAKTPWERYPDAAVMRTALAYPAAAAAADAAGAGHRTPEDLPHTAEVRTDGLFDETETETNEYDQPVEDRSQWQRVGVLAALGLVALMFGVATVLVSGQGGGEDTPGSELAGEQAQQGDVTRSPGSIGATSTTVEPGSPTTEAPVTTTSVASPTVDTIADVVSDDPDAFGEKGDSLVDKLRKAEREQGNQDNEARKAIDEISKWANEGQIDPAIAEEAISALEQLTT